jgi:FKBP-type peptidyl-prolyl cis-trans isomerase
MKRTLLTILLAGAVLCACSAGGSKEESSAAAGTNNTQNTVSGDAQPADKELSYAFGMAFGSDLKSFGIAYDYDEFLQGFKDAIEGNETITMDQVITKINTSLNEIYETQMAEAQEVEAVFLAENGAKPGITTTASGLQYEIITPAEGTKPTAEQTVVVKYDGTLIDGTFFDGTSIDNSTAEFPLNGVIPGWTEGIQYMSVGSKYRFFIPSNLGYGPQGAGNGLIPPYATLIFEVELLEIK